LETRLGSGATCRVLRDAAREIVGIRGGSIVVTDSGCENVNRDVDEELDGSNLERVLAQIGVTYSNSMIEAFWRPGIIQLSLPALDRSTTDNSPDPDEESVSYCAVIPCRMLIAMRHLLRLGTIFLRCIPAFFRSRNEQALVEFALRQQLAMYTQMGPRPRISPNGIAERWVGQPSTDHLPRPKLSDRPELAYSEASLPPIIATSGRKQRDPPDSNCFETVKDSPDE